VKNLSHIGALATPSTHCKRGAPSFKTAQPPSSKCHPSCERTGMARAQAPAISFLRPSYTSSSTAWRHTPLFEYAIDGQPGRTSRSPSKAMLAAWRCGAHRSQRAILLAHAPSGKISRTACGEWVVRFLGHRPIDPYQTHQETHKGPSRFTHTHAPGRPGVPRSKGIAEIRLELKWHSRACS
jgi:hypothetical protein